ncbi:MAG TPA: preprotein translocase subunit SecG [Parvibaculum sp.]|jgi:preprotein translocase subunit SecG
MTTILLIVHLMVAITLVALVLLQRSEGGALGIGGGGGGMMTGRGAGNVLTRATGIVGGLFFATSLALVVIASRGNSGGSMLDKVAPAPAGIQAPAPAVPAPLGSGLDQPKAQDSAPAKAAAPAPAPAPTEPSVPRAQ